MQMLVRHEWILPSTTTGKTNHFSRISTVRDKHYQKGKILDKQKISAVGVRKKLFKKK
jgi:hypothetical protein